MVGGDIVMDRWTDARQMDRQKNDLLLWWMDSGVDEHSSQYPQGFFKQEKHLTALWTGFSKRLTKR